MVKRSNKTFDGNTVAFPVSQLVETFFARMNLIPGFFLYIPKRICRKTYRLLLKLSKNFVIFDITWQFRHVISNIRIFNLTWAAKFNFTVKLNLAVPD